jgi:uncharacterized protein with HEPN domain
VTRGDEHRIADILDAATKLSERLQVPFETWRDDEDLRLVTERLVEIVGEAARAMTPEGRDATSGPSAPARTLHQALRDTRRGYQGALLRPSPVLATPKPRLARRSLARA